MSRATDRTRQILLERALDHLRNALLLCDQLAESVPACHLQHALDLLDSAAAAADGAGSRPH
jgi:hypothetical protein